MSDAIVAGVLGVVERVGSDVDDGAERGVTPFVSSALSGFFAGAEAGVAVGSGAGAGVGADAGVDAGVDGWTDAGAVADADVLSSDSLDVCGDISSSDTAFLPIFLNAAFARAVATRVLSAAC